MPPLSPPDHLPDADARAPLLWQPSLAGVDPPAFDGTFSSLARVELDGASWVDHTPGWLAGSDQLFDELLATVPWHQRSRLMYGRTVDEPRLTHWLAADQPWPALISTAGRLLSTHYQVEFDSAGLNLYRDGRDSVAWHRDRIPAEITDPVVALLSLGHPRRLLLRPRAGGPSRSFALGPGDLLVTGGLTQRRWEHTVPKVAVAGPRISVAFRHGVRRTASYPQVDGSVNGPDPEVGPAH